MEDGEGQSHTHFQQQKLLSWGSITKGTISKTSPQLLKRSQSQATSVTLE